MYKSSPIRWIGVATNWTSSGEVIWAILSEFFSLIVVFLWIYYPRIIGIVKAEAIAIISLKKNKPNEDEGKFRFSFDPNLWVSALSLIKLVVVLTANVIQSLRIESSTLSTWKWSAKLPEVYVDAYTKKTHLNSKLLIKAEGLVKKLRSPFFTPFHNGIRPLAFSMIALSTIVLKGETRNPDMIPVKTSIPRGTL